MLFILSNYISSRILFRAVMSSTLSAKKKTKKTQLCSIRLDSHFVCRGFMLCLCYLYLFACIGVQHVSPISDDVRVVQQLHDGCNMQSSNYRNIQFIPGLQRSSCCSIFSFLCNVLQIVVCPFVLFGRCILCPYTIYGF